MMPVFKQQSMTDLEVVDLAEYILLTKGTVRSSADKFKIGKTTVHSYLKSRLPKIDLDLSKQVNELITINKTERAKRGGVATHLRKLIRQRQMREG